MNAYAVVRDEHYERGDAIGVALTLGRAQDIAQMDCEGRLAVIGLPPAPLAWAANAIGPNPSWEGWALGRGLSFSYTVTRWEVVS